MLQNIDEVTKNDLIRELSPEAFRYFTETETGPNWGGFSMFNAAKFVRFGAGESARIILGSTIDYGPLTVKPFDREPTRESIFHKDLRFYFLGTLELGDEEYARVLESKGDRVALSGGGMLDAGRAILLNLSDDTKSLHFSGYSMDFGSADSAGRQETADVARIILGSSYDVIAT